MATRFISFLRVSRRFMAILPKRIYDNRTDQNRTNIMTRIMMCGLFTGLSKEKITEKHSKLEEPDALKLSREYLMKSAGIATTEQACILLTQAALALEEVRKQYSEALFAQAVLTEYKLQVLGNPAEEARIWDLILEARDLVTTARQQKQTLEIIVNNAKTIVNAGAEVAYITGVELVGNTTGDHLNKVEMFLRQSEQECSQAELKLRDTEVKCIEAESKHAKEQEELAAEAAKLAAELAEQDEENSDNEEPKTQTEDNNKEGEES